MATVLVLMPGSVLSPDRYAEGLAGEHGRELRRNPMCLCLGIDAVSPKSRKPLMEAAPSVAHGLCKTDATGTHARRANIQNPYRAVGAYPDLITEVLQRRRDETKAEQKPAVTCLELHESGWAQKVGRCPSATGAAGPMPQRLVRRVLD